MVSNTWVIVTFLEPDWETTNGAPRALSLGCEEAGLAAPPVGRWEAMPIPPITREWSRSVDLSAATRAYVIHPNPQCARADSGRAGQSRWLWAGCIATDSVP